MAVDFSGFKVKVNKSELDAMEERFKGQNSGGFPDLPSGVYPVELDKMEVGQSAWGADQINITFRITEGEHKGKLIFYNGTFDDHFAHGKPQTARLISEMTDGELDKFIILRELDASVQNASDYLTDLYQAIEGQRVFDLDYQVRESKKLNPNTNKPYINKFFSITEVFDA